MKKTQAATLQSYKGQGIIDDFNFRVRKERKLPKRSPKKVPDA